MLFKQKFFFKKVDFEFFLNIFKMLRLKKMYLNTPFARS